ncbi:response regulator transcription factor [Thioalbus denitrificans]|uniref:Two-component system response regulator PhoP n=1 Tax=Thioalbus denitrificans TaxID=547122 RepID=A0A369C9K7_9GAMM|nr:response regulator transcription factor [Thioalbus denitrificans]RCX30579.1 two-component system response regulator PhoP [Thioalbus denitrificans]
MRILVVEDEAQLREQLAARLRAEGYAVETAADGDEGLWQATEFPIDLAVIDLGLPGLPGDEIIRRARAAGRTFPVLILTARGRWEDKVEGLEAGADDYLVKPFHVEELLARIRALLRRAAGVASPRLEWGPLAIDTRTHSVTLGETPVELTAYEYRVLEYLALNSGRVISKTELTEHLYEEESDRDSNVIEVFVRRLRRKLDPDGRLQPIETRRGEGYRFNLAGDGSCG